MKLAKINIMVKKNIPNQNCKIWETKIIVSVHMLFTPSNLIGRAQN